MFYGQDVALGFLATTRQDGGPRVHPICPLQVGDGLYAFVVPGPKLGDLRRDGRFALHSETFPPPNHEDGCHLTGRAVEVHDAELRADLATRFFDERGGIEPWDGFEDETLFELAIAGCLVTLTEGRDDLAAGHHVWRA